MSAISTLKSLQVAPDLWLGYEEKGQSGLPVIFLHGLGNDHQTWKKNFPSFLPDFHCLVPDFPGYGSTNNPSIDYSIDFYSESILALIKKLDLENVILIGHSMGAQVAMTLVLKASNKVKKLVLIAPAGFEKFSQNEASWLKRLYQPEILQQVPRSEFIKNIESNFYNTEKVEKELISNYLNIFQSASYHQYCRTLCDNIRSMLEFPIFERLEEIKIPSLVIFGHQDQMIPNRLLHPHLTTQEIAEEGALKITNCTLSMINHAGHFVHWERSQLVNKIIMNFLQ